MDISSYFLYVSVSVIASISIGPSVILAASNGINFGRRKALSGVLGHVSAILMLALVSASGVGALLLASPTVFTVIKYLGVAYLIYIGLSIMRSKGSWTLKLNDGPSPSGFRLYRNSLLLGLSNPKALVFFTALFPQFIDPNASLLPQFLLLAGTSLCNAFVFTFGYALLAHKFKSRLLPMINNGWLGRITGSLFLGFAAILAVAR
jgi:threonine/homoserine/homoserine lactone efflux protein